MCVTLPTSKCMVGFKGHIAKSIVTYVKTCKVRNCAKYVKYMKYIQYIQYVQHVEYGFRTIQVGPTWMSFGKSMGSPMHFRSVRPELRLRKCTSSIYGLLEFKNADIQFRYGRPELPHIYKFCITAPQTCILGWSDRNCQLTNPLDLNYSEESVCTIFNVQFIQALWMCSSGWSDLNCRDEIVRFGFTVLLLSPT